MKLRVFSLLIIFLILIAPALSADVISLNSGGTGNVIVNPGSWIENFFFGQEEGVAAPVCGNGINETGEECDDGNIIAGDGCSATCTIEVVIPDDGGGGGGGGETPTGTLYNLQVEPNEFNINLAINTNLEETITITNLDTETANFTISAPGLEGKVLLSENSMSIEPGKSKTLDIVFVALSQTGIFTGSIAIGDEEVLVTINIRTVLLLFDSNIVVLNDDYLVPQGNDLQTMVTLLPMGEKQRMDVTLNYVIKDYKDKIYLTKSETLLIEEQIEFQRNFDTGALPLGKYVVGLELIYPNGVAPSSAHFEVTEAPPIDIFSILIWILIILILIILIIIVIIQIKRQKDKEKAASGTSKPPVSPVGTVKPKAPPATGIVRPKIPSIKSIMPTTAAKPKVLPVKPAVPVIKKPVNKDPLAAIR